MKAKIEILSKLSECLNNKNLQKIDFTTQTMNYLS